MTSDWNKKVEAAAKKWDRAINEITPDQWQAAVLAAPRRPVKPPTLKQRITARIWRWRERASRKLYPWQPEDY